MRERRIEPEILDGLKRDDPRAIRARRDLRRLNDLMAHVGIFDRQLGLSRSACRPKRLLELGAGDGWMTYQLVSRMPDWMQGGQITIVDQQPCLSENVLGALDSAGWTVTVEETDLFDFLRRPHRGRPFDYCWVNLMMHHFRDQALREIFERLQRRTLAIAACEPRRARLSAMAARCVGWVGCGPVTRYDAVVSVDAGFHENDLTQLWPRHRDWMIQERAVGLFSHFFHARRFEN